MSLSGKVAVVTGGGQRAGLAVSTRLLAEGATVVIAENDALAGALAAEELESKGEVHYVDADVASEPSVKAVIERVLTAYGRLDFLIQCASIDRPVSIDDRSLENWHRVIEVNLTGALLFAKHAAPHLAETKGTIVNVAATRPIADKPNSEAYAASKAGLVGLTEALAVSLAPHVRVNCISPAWGGTNLALASGECPETSQAGGVSSPEKIAEWVVQLCSDPEKVPTGRNIILPAA